MFRFGLARIARPAGPSAAAAATAVAAARRRQFSVIQHVIRNSRVRAPIASKSAVIFSSRFTRSYSAPAGLAKEEIEGRILDLLKNFEKVSDASKVTSTSNFANDLGLDSLDTVEVVMAIEEEFSIEIPDEEADAIHSVDQAVNYILSQPDAH